MEEVAQYCERVVVMDHGRLAMLDQTRNVFSQKEVLEQMGLDIPQVTELFYRLNRDNPNVRKDILTVEEGVLELKRIMGGHQESIC
jgi:ABC-type hemin transport system ATPase subunit